jgi:pantothenate kinase
MTAGLPPLPPVALARANALLAGGGRRILGLVGPPGGGKSTLAAALQAAFADLAQIVPMDGFHLANSELRRLGRTERKGAPDTFDAAGYVALMRRLRGQPADETVYAPEFRREIEEAIAGAIAVAPNTRLVITEGNYLLLDQAPWRELRSVLDDTWYIGGDDTVRRERLIRRHEEFGRTREAAVEWVDRSDEANARLVAASRGNARFDFDWDGSAPSTC